jgi:hypothetical protein
MGEPLLFSFTWYSWGFLGVAILGCKMLRWVKARNPEMSNLGLIAHALGVAVLIDVVLELFYVIFGFYFYGNTVKGLTVFSGHYYQFPVYECLLWPAAWTALVCIRYFRDDKNQSFFERGLDRVRGGHKRKSFVSMCAILGAMQVIYLGMYVIPYIFITTVHPGDFPADLQKRSYLMSGICGPHTDFSCPNKDLPVNRRGAAHFNSNYELVPGKNGLPTAPVTKFEGETEGEVTNQPTTTTTPAKVSP